MLKMTGFDNLQKTLQKAQEALATLGVELGTVQFNPTDPASIDAAIQSVEVMVDERLGAYLDNPIINPLAEQMKEKYRDAILERAATARLEGTADGK